MLFKITLNDFFILFYTRSTLIRFSSFPWSSRVQSSYQKVEYSSIQKKKKKKKKEKKKKKNENEKT